MVFDKNTGKGVDIDYIEHADGSIDVLYVDKLTEGDLNVWRE